MLRMGQVFLPRPLDHKFLNWDRRVPILRMTRGAQVHLGLSACR
jgi:hypothetical protein